MCFRFPAGAVRELPNSQERRSPPARPSTCSSALQIQSASVCSRGHSRWISARSGLLAEPRRPPVAESESTVPVTSLLKRTPLIRLLIIIAVIFSSPPVPAAMASPPFPQQLRRGLVPTRLGLVHYTATTAAAEGNNKLPIVGLHMSPRSVDEYREIMELVGCDRMFVAMDELGYGGSDNPTESCTLDDIADCFLEVLDALRVPKCIVAGSLMGCYLALSLASRYPGRVEGVVCSNLYHFTGAAREKALKEEAEQKKGVIPDSWELKEDGSHISEIWDKRASWLTPELNTRVTWDNFNYLLKRRQRYAKGTHIQDGGAFPLEATCKKVSCPVLCINGAGAVGFFDMIGMEMSSQFEQSMAFFPTMPAQVVLEPPGASINMLNENAKEWLEHVNQFAGNLEG